MRELTDQQIDRILSAGLAEESEQRASTRATSTEMTARVRGTTRGRSDRRPFLLMAAALLLVGGAAVWIGTRPQLNTPPPTQAPALLASSSPTSSATPATTPSAAPEPTPTATSDADPSPNAAAWGVTNPDGTVWIMHEPGLRFGLMGDDGYYIGWARVGDNWDIDRIHPPNNRPDHIINLAGTANPIHGMGAGGSVWLSSWDRNSVTRYGPISGVSSEIDELPVGTNPIEPVLAFGDIWTLNNGSSNISRIDTESGEVVATIELAPLASPVWMSEGAGSLWLVGTNSSIYEIDPETNTVARVIETGHDCLMQVGYIANRLWASSCESPEAVVVDPETAQVTMTPKTFHTIQPYVAANGALWLPRAESGDYIDALIAIDPVTADTIAEFELVERMPAAGFQFGFDSMWIAAENGALRVPESALPTT